MNVTTFRSDIDRDASHEIEVAYRVLITTCEPYIDAWCWRET